MNGPTLSVVGLYMFDNTIFDDLLLPNDVDKDDVVNNILMETAELETIYPNTDTFKWAVGVWSAKLLPKWQRIDNVLEMEYNPLENYDRQETWSDGNESNSLTNTSTLSDATGAQQGTSNGESTLTVAGFDSETLTNREKTSTSASNGSNTVTHNQNTGQSTGNIVSESQHTGRAHGNIGVTTSQQMLESEVDVASINMIQIIVDDFKKQFCLCVY